MEPLGLSPSQFNVLNLLSDNPQGCSQIELGRLLITHRSNMTGLVDRLVRRGLVARRDSAEDRRAYRIVLTQAGRKMLNHILPSYYQAAEQIWRGATIRNSARLADELELLSDQAGRTVENYHTMRRVPKGLGPRHQISRTGRAPDRRNTGLYDQDAAKAKRAQPERGSP
jgi:DNA-binding MarR family transcriptional regulator